MCLFCNLFLSLRLTFTECLLWTTYHCWTLVLLHSHFQTVLVVVDITPVCAYLWENWCSERVLNLPKVTQVVSARVKCELLIWLWSGSFINVLQCLGLHWVLTQKAPSIVLGPRVIEKQKACFPKTRKLLINDFMQSSRVNSKEMVAFMETLKIIYWYLPHLVSDFSTTDQRTRERAKRHLAVNNDDNNNSIDSISNWCGLSAF